MTLKAFSIAAALSLAACSSDSNDEVPDSGQPNNTGEPDATHEDTDTGEPDVDSEMEQRDTGGTDEDRNHVFVTSAEWRGQFWIESDEWPDGSSGPKEADRRCESAALAANLPGEWRSWLSTSRSGDDSAGPAADRIEDVGPWYLVGTDQIVFNNLANVLNTPLAPINRDEHGRLLEGVAVWTGTRVGGELGTDCLGWETQASGSSGTVGSNSSTDAGWTDSGAMQCRGASHAHLYCFQQ